MKKLGLAVSFVFALSLLAGCGDSNPPCTCDQSELEAQVAALEAQVAALQTDLTTVDSRLSTIESNDVILLDQYLNITTSTDNELPGPHVIFEGVNVHIRSGGGATDASINGLGNLLVGYNEVRVGLPPGSRGGSHNLIMGPEHSYSSYGGFVVGYRNTVSTQYASGSGGYCRKPKHTWVYSLVFIASVYDCVCRKAIAFANALNSACLPANNP